MTIFIYYRALSELFHQDDGKVIYSPSTQQQKIQQYRQQLFSQFLLTDLRHEIVVHEDIFGKPYLKDFPHLCFNQSHSQNYYALAYSKDYKHIGIDIEDFSRTVRMEALAKRFFHINELNQWLALGQDKKFWFKVWTAKEAVLKAHGLGIRLRLSDLDTAVCPEKRVGVLWHKQLGQFRYEHIDMESSMLCIAYEDIGNTANLKLQ
ncbi:4'-phosphopantetheinyl transferase family protein [Acinetobacter boissieri]|uniref:4'-phosphopantetheinyl transferase n=1 Tax=Acinetobacter boissieri TaxID=1219383 RepID=A0A1G6GG66_9GAMM|nr:4'-phosphopantetheinyl transferase superfamily protein [Acinetobacter boissieri]SDB80954.1 4'-phosphopantetheinyl transferase [Acinetobacter boissieri]